MNISKSQQRTLHALAQGGRILLERDETGHAVGAECLTREGWRLETCDIALFRKLKARGWIASREGGAYRITRDGLVAVRAQANNR